MKTRRFSKRKDVAEDRASHKKRMVSALRKAHELYEPPDEMRRTFKEIHMVYNPQMRDRRNRVRNAVQVLPPIQEKGDTVKPRMEVVQKEHAHVHPRDVQKTPFKEVDPAMVGGPEHRLTYLERREREEKPYRVYTQRKRQAVREMLRDKFDIDMSGR